MEWQEAYKRNCISADEAASFVKSGGRVVCTQGREPLALLRAIAARKGELGGVEVFIPSPTYDVGWYDEGWEDSFKCSIFK